MRLASVAFAAAVVGLVAIGGCTIENNQTSTPTTPGGTKVLQSPSIPNGQNWSHTFTAPGTYGYHCGFHSVMTGTVRVISGKPATATVTIATSTTTGFQPHAVEVAPLGTVTWTNQSGATHTVTSN